MLKIPVATALAITLASAGAASAKMRHHQYRQVPNARAPPNAQIGQPGAYGSPGNLTPGYSSTARHKPADTNAGGGGSQ